MFINEWQALCPGESPGDPELGGWRPPFRKKSNILRINKRQNIQLKDVLALLATKIEYLNVHEAIESIGSKASVLGNINYKYN